MIRVKPTPSPSQRGRGEEPNPNPSQREERRIIKTKTMNTEEDNFNIMVGGLSIGTAKSGMLTYLDTVEKTEEPKYKEFNKSWDIEYNVLVKEGDASDMLKDMMRKPLLVNVMEELIVCKMPRKMKKAYRRDPYGKTKYGRKALNYRRRDITTLNNAEMVLTKKDQETLMATITKANENPVPFACISGEAIVKGLQRRKGKLNF